MSYPIEQIGLDHPLLCTGDIEACVVVRCRESDEMPWPLNVDCRDAPTAGTAQHLVEITWEDETDQRASKASNTYQDRRVTENAAIGIGAATFAVLSEGCITEVTQEGDGVDYWVDDRRAVLEVSGIGDGSQDALVTRHAQKERQLRQSWPYRRQGKPGYVFVVQFDAKDAVLSYHR